MKQKHFIDSHKGATGLVVLLLIAVYGQWYNPTAWVYLALHGTYGVLWVLKSQIFPDKSWEKQTGWGYGLVIWAGLSLYWITPWLIVSQSITAPSWWQSICIVMYSLGIFLHFTADMQKHIALQYRPGHLIDTGFWQYCRNPNYLGELLIYVGFGLLALHWAPLVVLGLFIIFVWLPNMRKKDRSLARYPTFAAYKARTKLLLPFIF
ncbi:MAG: DUF1295 domain-containing protein [Chloroflexota bacterium]